MAEQIFLLCLSLLSVGHLLLTVNETAKVRLFAAITLIERGAMVGELLGFAVVGITLSAKSLIVEYSLAFSMLKSFPFNVFFQG